MCSADARKHCGKKGKQGLNFLSISAYYVKMCEIIEFPNQRREQPVSTEDDLFDYLENVNSDEDFKEPMQIPLTGWFIIGF